MAVKDDPLQKAKRKVSEQKQESAAKRVKANSGAKEDIRSAPQAAEKVKGGPASGKQQEKQQKHRSKTIQDAIMKWETLRRHDISTKQREELISTLMQELKGRLAGMAASPSGSRILQACVKHGSPEQRSQILDELQPSFLELSKSPYAHFLVCKLIDTAPKSATEGFMKAFKGQVVKLLRHPCGSRVINELYTRASGKQRKLLAAEFYGREMVIFSQDAAPKTLAECLGSMDDTGKHRVVQQMSINLIPVLEKGLLDPILVHGLVAEYMEAAPPTAVADVVEMLAGPPLLHMVHSRPGATAACQVLAMATAKQRKKVIKAMKGHVKVMAIDEWAHVVLMAALEHTDDTALLRKTLVPELLADLGDLCQHKVACNIFVHLLAPSNRAYLPPHVSALLAPRPAAAMSTKSAPEAPAAASDVPEEEVPSTVAAPVSSKKDAVLRRQELLSSGKGSLVAELTSVCATNATKLLLSPRGCDLLVEAACGSEGGLLMDACPEGVALVQDAIVAATRDEPGTSDEGLTEPVMENFFGSRALKKLIGRGQGSDRAASEARKVAAKLWESSMKGKCKALSSSHAAKVLAAVFLFADKETRENVKRELLVVMEDEASIKAWAERALGAKAEAKQRPEQQQRKKKKK
ncbi:Pumilio homolog 3 [Coccomyxa sp. Obi]|nr:Pumilio homolog 3 [Coccomyxa sp. Obi]